MAIKLNGSYVTWDEALGLSVEQRRKCHVDLTAYFKSSKTDQDAMGALRTHRCGCYSCLDDDRVTDPAAATSDHVCVVCTMLEHVACIREEGPLDPDALLFPSVTRAKLSKAVKGLMIFVEGKSAGDATDTHSLRIGGCTALYGATENVDIARRWGRWHPSSQMPFLYSWDVIGPRGRGIAADMASFDFSLHDALIRATRPGEHPLR